MFMISITFHIDFIHVTRVPKLWSVALRWSTGSFEVVPRVNATSTLIVCKKKSFNPLDSANLIKRVLLFPGQLKQILKIIYNIF